MSFEISPLEPRMLLANIDPSAVYYNPIAKTALSIANFPHQANGPLATGSSTPQGLNPTQVRTAYGVNNILFGNIVGDGAGQTIAIVDAFHSPTALTDLQAFDTAFGLPNPPSFVILNQQGQPTPVPATDPTGGWELEAALDVQWVHAMAPAANLILFEANDNSNANMFAAVDAARRFPSVSVVSMSFGASEFPGQVFQDATLTTPIGHQGVTFVASAGDDGAFATGTTLISPNYPASSPNVVSVGGTRLTLNGNAYGSESGWGDGQNSGFTGGGGGGISNFEAQPVYQRGIVTQSTTLRCYPDVAMVADPATGVAVYNEFNFGDGGPGTGWVPGGVGGTSLSGPLWAGLIGIANQGRQTQNLPSLDGVSQVLPRLYQLPTTVFHDITTGDNGYPASEGYDLATGLGTPIADQLVPGLNGPFIGNLVFNDANIDGIQNDEDSGGVPDIQVQLISVGVDGAVGGTDDVVVLTTTTDANGEFGFSQMASGSYYLHFQTTTGFQISLAGQGGDPTLDSNADPLSGNTGIIVVTPATFDTTIDCGMFQKSVSISDASITEGNAGFKTLTFTVTLAPTNSAIVNVTFGTVDVTATIADADYVTTSGTLVFVPGVLSQTISVQVVGDAKIENTETFQVNISTPIGFAATKNKGVGTIINDDFPAVTVSSVTKTRPNVGTIDYPFVVTLSAPAPFEVRVPFTTEDNTAVQGTDFVKTSGELVFTPGQVTQIVHVTVIGGTNPQLDKIFFLDALPSSTVTVGTPGKGVGTIISNSPPAVTADDAQVTQSLTGVALLAFNVRVEPSLTGTVTVSYTTADGTAIAGVDYTPQSGILTFIPGRIVQTVFVPVSNAFSAGGAGNKTLTLNLSNIVATGSVPIFGRATATGTIHDLATNSITFGSAKRALYTDNLNHRVLLQLVGPGTGAIVFLGSSPGSTDAVELQLNNTTAASTLLVRTAGGQTSFRNINASGSVGGIVAPTTNLLGTLTTVGGLNRVNLNYVQAGNITVGGGTGSLAVTFSRALDTSITSVLPISTITAQAYLNTDGIPDIIGAPSVGAIRVRGNFGGTILSNTVNAVFVGGAIQNASIQTSGSLGAVIAGRISDSTIFAGVRSGLSGLPTSSDDFVNKDAHIARIAVRAGGFSNTLVAGWRIGAVSLGRVQTTVGAATFGVSGDRVGAVTAFADSSVVRVIGADDPLASRTMSNFVVRAV